uniref:Uncharacterized protein n=1 Tax=Manihot esculenta TaxID=3983 RepID=A0A2C9VK69_MANES
MLSPHKTHLKNTRLYHDLLCSYLFTPRCQHLLLHYLKKK